MSSEISEELRDFIQQSITSVSLLELLFLLKKDATKKWSPEEVSLAMRTNPSYASVQLSELSRRQLVQCEKTGEDKVLFWFDPESPHRRLVEQLEALYLSRRATVINYIYSQPIDSIRNFADAFKIKKD